MNSILNAQASAAGYSGTTSQDPSITKTDDQNINRDSVEQGNKSAEKSLNKPLGCWDQINLIKSAMNGDRRSSFDVWGNHVFASFIISYKKEGTNLLGYSTFFRDLLLFLSKPKIAAKFDESLPDGTKMIKRLSDLFLELQALSGYEEYAIYHSLSNFYHDEKDEFLYFAEKYLTGNDLRRVLDANGVQEQKAINGTIKDSVAEDQALIAALDRHFPGVKWPTYVYNIVHDPRMKVRLELLEEERLKPVVEPELSQEEKQAREIRKVIDYQLDYGYHFRKMDERDKARQEQAEEKMFEIPPSKLPLDLKTLYKPATAPVGKGKGGTVAKKKPVKAPALAKKNTPKKKA